MPTHSITLTPPPARFCSVPRAPRPARSARGMAPPRRARNAPTAMAGLARPAPAPSAPRSLVWRTAGSVASPGAPPPPSATSGEPKQFIACGAAGACNKKHAGAGRSRGSPSGARLPSATSHGAWSLEHHIWLISFHHFRAPPLTSLAGLISDPDPAPPLPHPPCSLDGFRLQTASGVQSCVACTVANCAE